MIPELETERLRLRGWQVEDFDGYAEFVGDPSLNMHRGGAVDRITAWNDFCSMAGQWLFRGIGVFAVEEKSSGNVAGYAGLWHPDDLEEPELCWSLYEAYHGKGYATEAANGAIAWAYDSKALPPLMSFVHPNNSASKHVAERLGALCEGEAEFRGSPRLVYRHRSTAHL